MAHRSNKLRYAALAALMSNMNKLIYDASSSNRYATVFYAQYDPPSRSLTYVNAGHNPPMLLRGSGLMRLEEGGPVVGLLGPSRYAQATVTLEPGDLLVAFTDGISEAMNLADEEWDEERLLVAVRKCAGLTAAAMLPKIIAAADEFVAGAPQHDDMTLVVVRVLG
jgi:sigma-B regulation protein RsbU (phosphoserine phosphatase)